MSETLAISSENIIHQIKLSCQMPAIAEKILTRKVIEKTAQKQKIVVETEELQNAANEFRVKNNLLGSKATMSWLQKYSLSVDDFEEMLYFEILADKLAKHLFADRVESYFFENQVNYIRASFSEIVLDNLDFAMELFYALEEKEISFAEVARQYIEDVELRRCGGYRGWLNRNELKPEIAAAVFAANPPQVVRPIVVNKKIYLIQVEEIAKLQLDDKLRTQIRDKLYTDWLQQEIKQIKVI
ncbi:MAG: peptidylprolyl isomerase [Xenococcaceae cyanobacterium]